MAIPAAGFLVRLFMIQHDCGHGAFFPYRWANDWSGRAIGVLTMTPYDLWRRKHAVHHATSGNLDLRGIGDVDTLTVREFLALSRWGRLKYRVYRNPIVMFGIGSCLPFLLQQRLPVGFMRNGWQPWVSTQATNAAIVLIAAVLIYVIGIKAFFLIHMPTMLLAATFGVWLFYVQHQFEDTFWSESSVGISMKRLCTAHRTTICRFSCAGSLAISAFTTCITSGSRIPYYRLPAVLHDYPELRDIGRMSLMQSLRSVRFALWDEKRCRRILFREVHKSVKM